MLRTVSLPVDLPKERIFPLLAVCADVFNQHTEWSLKERTYNKNKAHQALYTKLRSQSPKLPSALVQAIRDTAMEAVKAVQLESQPQKKPTSGIRYGAQTMTLRGQQLTLFCIGKRLETIITIPAFFQPIVNAGKLTYQERSRQFFFQESFTPAIKSGHRNDAISTTERLYRLKALRVRADGSAG